MGIRDAPYCTKQLVHKLFTSMAVMNSKATECKMILGKQSDDTLDYFKLFDAYRNNFETGKPKLMKHQN